MKVLIVFAAILAIATAAGVPVVKLHHMNNLPIGILLPETRIIGGEKAIEGQFPYQVGLSLSKSSLSSSTSWCGGSLITTEWVLTAAHCTYQMKTAIVYLGATRRTEAQQIITSKKLYIHNQYEPRTFTNDISLIKLPVKAIINDYVKISVLPKMASTYSTYQNQTVIASGWGKTTDNTIFIAEDLFYIFRIVNPNSDCALVYGDDFVRESNICVDTHDGCYKKSTCNGDSGGPLVLNDSTRTQIGLTSYGAGEGCEQGYPVVFTRITSYLEWISEITGVSL